MADIVIEVVLHVVMVGVPSLHHGNSACGRVGESSVWGEEVGTCGRRRREDGGGEEEEEEGEGGREGATQGTHELIKLIQIIIFYGLFFQFPCTIIIRIHYNYQIIKNVYN